MKKIKEDIVWDSGLLWGEKIIGNYFQYGKEEPIIVIYNMNGELVSPVEKKEEKKGD
jgi:hypothetical protein